MALVSRRWFTPHSWKTSCSMYAPDGQIQSKYTTTKYYLYQDNLVNTQLNESPHTLFRNFYPSFWSAKTAAVLTCARYNFCSTCNNLHKIVKFDLLDVCQITLYVFPNLFSIFFMCTSVSCQVGQNMYFILEICSIRESFGFLSGTDYCFFGNNGLEQKVFWVAKQMLEKLL